MHPLFFIKMFLKILLLPWRIPYVQVPSELLQRSNGRKEVQSEVPSSERKSTESPKLLKIIRQTIFVLVIYGWGIKTSDGKGAAARGGGGHGESE
jgi:hypothetical protein